MLRVLAAIVLTVVPSAVQAHLMPAQHGTLNIVDGGGFLVLSLPISAFPDIDDDGDQQLSPLEFVAHRSAMLDAVREFVRLYDAGGDKPLGGLVASPASGDQSPADPVGAVTFLGRFDLAQRSGRLTLQLSLADLSAHDHIVRIRVTRQADQLRRVLLFTARDQAQVLFPTHAERVSGFLFEGASHVLLGPDHLLLLLAVFLGAFSRVALAATGFAVLAGLLTAFALGSSRGVPWTEASVEVTIAAALIVIPVFDLSVRSARQISVQVCRVTLVYAASLVHGLGLFAALLRRVPNLSSALPEVFGYSIGVVIAVGALVLLTAGAVRLSSSILPERLQLRLRAVASVLVLVSGIVWVIQRL